MINIHNNSNKMISNNKTYKNNNKNNLQTNKTKKNQKKIQKS